MKKVKIQLETKESKLSFEIHSGLSETVEGQSLPVRDILIKFRNGTLDTNIGKQVFYDNLQDFITDPTLSPDFDLADATMLQENLAQIIAEKNAQEAFEKSQKDQQITTTADKLGESSKANDNDKGQ
jgi:hypothetical protein